MRSSKGSLSASAVLNQAVLLRGINDTRIRMWKLCETVQEAYVRPYYVFNCSFRNPQFAHFRVPVEKGRDIIESMYGNIVGDAIPHNPHPGRSIIRTRAAAKADHQILLMGHMDTVFPVDTDFIEFRQDNSRSYGPGVSDMKGGLVVAVYALKALDALGLLDDLPITMVCNSDEEIGSPTSRDLIRREAAKSDFAFVMEAGGANGEVVTGRKGNMVLEFLAEGTASHAAFMVVDKASAVHELCHQVIGLEALNDPAAGISVNVGMISGGIGHNNTVPAEASALIDFRFADTVQQATLQDAVAALSAFPTIKGTRVITRIRSERPAMPECAANTDLFAILAQVAQELGMAVKVEYRFGVSDANIIANQGVPVLDSLGPIGGDDHSSSEYMITASLAQRTCLLACAMKRCWKKSCLLL